MPFQSLLTHLTDLYEEEFWFSRKALTRVSLERRAQFVDLDYTVRAEYHTVISMTENGTAESVTVCVIIV